MSSYADLDPGQIKAFSMELDALGRQVRRDLGEKDVRHIRKMQRIAWSSEAVGRIMLMASFYWPCWFIGVAALAVSKIIENTELGHNIMHGQFDWTRDPSLRGQDYEFDAVATSDNWRASHNHHHHLNTGIIGLDNDIGMIRFAAWQPWRWHTVFQVPLAVISALLTQWAVGVQNMRLGDLLHGTITPREFWRQRLAPLARKSARKLFKDYLLFPAIAGPMFLPVFAGNLAANGLRNIWVWVVIACGHCVGGVHVYRQEDVSRLPREHWFVRQVTSSANFSSGPTMAVLTGHLGYHIEHHLYPDIPANRYPEMAPVVREICRRYGISYNSRPFNARVRDLLYRMVRYSLPAPPASPGAAS